MHTRTHGFFVVGPLSGCERGRDEHNIRKRAAHPGGICDVGDDDDDDAYNVQLFARILLRTVHSLDDIRYAIANIPTL